MNLPTPELYFGLMAFAFVISFIIWKVSEPCKHKNKREVWHNAVVDYYCAECDEWLGDKDFS